MGLCMFCYKPVKDNESVIIAEDNDAKLKLTNFVKLVKGFVGEEWDDENGADLLEEGLLVDCCGDCSVIVNSFNEAYHQLKLLEEQLEWKLGSLISIMDLANRIPLRVQRLNQLFREYVENQDDKEEDEMESKKQKLDGFKTFRINLMKLCNRRLGKSKPGVVVEKQSSWQLPVDLVISKSYSLSDNNSRPRSNGEEFIAQTISIKEVLEDENENVVDITDWVPVPNDASYQAGVSHKAAVSCLGNDTTFIRNKNTSLGYTSRQSLQDPEKHDVNHCQINQVPSKNGTDYNAQPHITNDSGNQARITQGNEGSGNDANFSWNKTGYLEGKSRQTTKRVAASNLNPSPIDEESSKNDSDLNGQAPLKKPKKNPFWCDTCSLQLASFSTFRLHKSSHSHLTLTMGKLLGKEMQMKEGDKRISHVEEDVTMATPKKTGREKTHEAQIGNSKDEQTKRMAGMSLADLVIHVLEVVTTFCIRKLETTLN